MKPLPYISPKLLRPLKLLSISLLLTLLALVIGRNNANWYQATIGQIVSIDTQLDTEKMETSYTKDNLYIQTIRIRLLNGSDKGQFLDVINRYSETTAIEEHYRIFDQVFVEIVSSGRVYITGVKRDWILFMCTAAFLSLAILIGKRKGTMALLSIGINLLITVLTIPLLTKRESPLAIMVVCSMVFTIVSFLSIHGWQKQSLAGLLSTAACLLVSVAIASIVLKSIHYNTLDYDQMEYLTYLSAELIFMMEVILGGLGAIIDIANTMNTSIRELCVQNENITPKELWTSGMAIGRDIMGTMTNVLFFVFLSGSIPATVLWICNQVTVGEVLQHFLSLEIARALTGGISVVLSIPISLYIAIAIQKGAVKWL